MLHPVIDLEKTVNLQEALTNIYSQGLRKIELMGKYVANDEVNHLLRLYSSLTGLTLIGHNAVLDGKHKTSHVLVIEDASVILIGLTICGGDTANPKRVAKHYSGANGRRIYESIDGAGILILRDSKVSIENCVIEDNYSGMCGGGISNQGINIVRVKNCKFSNNKSYHTGSAVDNLSSGSNIAINSSQFNNNMSNIGSLAGGPHGQITLFGNTKASVLDCKFTGTNYPIDTRPNTLLKESGNIWNKKPTKSRRPGGNKGLLIYFKHAIRLAAFEVRHLKYWLYPRVR